MRAVNEVVHSLPFSLLHLPYRPYFTRKHVLPLAPLDPRDNRVVAEVTGDGVMGRGRAKRGSQRSEDT